MKINLHFSSFMQALAVMTAVSLLSPAYALDENNAAHQAVKRFMEMPMKDLLALVPENTPLSECWGKHMDGAETRFRTSICPKSPNHRRGYWKLENPEVITCLDCGGVYPSEEYPENATETYTNCWGTPVTVHCHYAKGTENKKKRTVKLKHTDTFYFRAMVHSGKHKWLRDQMKLCGELYNSNHLTDAQRHLLAERIGAIFLKYTRVIKGWSVAKARDGSSACYVNYDPNAGDQSLFPDVQFSYQTYTPDKLFSTLIPFFNDDALSQIPEGETRPIRQIITEDFFEEMFSIKGRYPKAEKRMGNFMCEPRMMARFAWGLNSAASAHYAIRFSRNFRTCYPKSYDGLANEGIGYHGLGVDNYTYGMMKFIGWKDPEGYVDARDGTTFSTPLTIDDIFPGMGYHGWWVSASPSFLFSPDGEPCGSHDNAYRGLLSDYTSEESHSRILPGQGHLVLGDGRGEQQIQSQLHYSTINTGHAAFDSLSYQLFAQGRTALQFSYHQNYTKTSVNKSVVQIDHQSQSAMGVESRGLVEIYAPTLPGLSVARVHRDGQKFMGRSRKAGRYRRTLLQNTVDLNHPYVLDIFEVTGGKTHEYTLVGSMRHAQTASANTKMKRLSGKTPLGTDSKGWGRFSNVDEGTITKGTYAEFSYDDKKASGLRLHLSAMTGDTLQLARLANVADGDVDTRPALIIKRETPDEELASTFVVVMEPYDGKADIIAIRKIKLGADSTAIQVNLSDRIDTYLVSFNGPQKMNFGSYSAHATIAGFSRAKKNAACDVWLIDGTQASCKARKIKAENSSLVGQVLKVYRTDGGDGRNSVVTDMKLPLGRELAGQFLMLEGYKASGELHWTQGYTIEEVQPAGGGKREVVLRYEPDLVLEKDGSIRETMMDYREAPTHKLRLVTCKSSVPSIVNVTPGIPRWKPENVQDNDGRAFDLKLTPQVTTLPAGAPVHYTTNGTLPTAKSPIFGDDVVITKNSKLWLAPMNPKGITKPYVRRERYYKRKPAFTGNPGSPGITHTVRKRSVVIKDIETKTVGDNSFKLTGFILAPKTGLYHFRSRSKGRMTLWIDRDSILHHNFWWGLGSRIGEVYLEKGYHSIKITYKKEGKDPWFSMDWNGPDFEWQPIPSANLFTSLKSDNAVVLTYKADPSSRTIEGERQQVLSPDGGDGGTCVYARAKDGWQFRGWSDNHKWPYRTDSPKKSLTVTANFRKFSSDFGFQQSTWNNVKETFLGDFMTSSRFRKSANQTTTVNRLEMGRMKTKQVRRVAGILCAPVTGEYQIKLNAKDNAQLWWSSGNSPDNKKKIAWMDSREFKFKYDHPTEMIATVRLKAGETYYVELLSLKRTNKDYASVDWRGPGFGAFHRIDSAFIED